MRRKYFIINGDFGNVYTLVYAENSNQLAALPQNAEQITRKQAISYAVQESYRRKFDSAFSGYADTTISPADYNHLENDISTDNRFSLVGRIWEHKNNY